MNRQFIELRKTLGKFISNFSVEKTKEGKELIFDGEEVFEGLEVNTYNEQGEIVALEDGEYEIKGVKVEIANGKVSAIVNKEPSKLPQQDEPKVDLKDEPKDEPKNEPQPNEEVESLKAEIESLKAERDAVKAENEDLKKQVADLKATPMDSPVPQRTNMSTINKDVADNVKGTKFERACKIFNS